MIIEASTHAISLAAKSLQDGEVISLPTETVYGLAANAYLDEAVQRIYTLKGRPSSNPLIVHIASLDQLTQVAVIPKGSILESRLARLTHFWPGPLSIILPKHPRISMLVTAGLDTVAVRIPRHPIALSILAAAQIPAAAPSANLSTSISPTSAQHVEESFGTLLPPIIDGGSCEVGLESSVVSIVGDKVRILRPGAVTREQLEKALDEPVGMVTISEHPTPQPCYESPGMMELHYAPRTPLRFLSELTASDRNKSIGLLTFGATSPPHAHGIVFATIRTLPHSHGLEEAAAQLYATLRDLDHQNLDLILVDSCAEDGIGFAIMDRLRRARH